MGKGKDCGCGCEGRGDCKEKEEMSDEMNEARRVRKVVRGGKLIRTKRTSMSDKRAAKQYYRRNKRKIVRRRKRREIRPEFRRQQRMNLRKKKSLGMAEDIGGLVESIDQHLHGDMYEDDDEMDDDEMDEMDEMDVMEALEAQLEEAEELAEEFEGTEFGALMANLAQSIAENLDALQEDELDLEDAVSFVESGDAILDYADSLIS
jgi:hypothetical protein